VKLSLTKFSLNTSIKFDSLHKINPSFSISFLIIPISSNTGEQLLSSAIKIVFLVWLCLKIRLASSTTPGEIILVSIKIIGNTSAKYCTTDRHFNLFLTRNNPGKISK
jgi:hypothetical protein